MVNQSSPACVSGKEGDSTGTMNESMLFIYLNCFPPCFSFLALSGIEGLPRETASQRSLWLFSMKVMRKEFLVVCLFSCSSSNVNWYRCCKHKVALLNICINYLLFFSKAQCTTTRGNLRRRVWPPTWKWVTPSFSCMRQCEVPGTVRVSWSLSLSCSCPPGRITPTTFTRSTNLSASNTSSMTELIIYLLVCVCVHLLCLQVWYIAVHNHFEISSRWVFFTYKSLSFEGLPVVM